MTDREQELVAAAAAYASDCFAGGVDGGAAGLDLEAALVACPVGSLPDALWPLLEESDDLVAVAAAVWAALAAFASS